MNTPTGVEKTSVLDDIDFEIELIRRDDINVTYILTLLKELDYNSPSFEKDKEFIIGTMEKSRELRSKVQLIEQFIDNNIPQIENKDHIEENFEIFLEKEKEKAIDTLIKEEKLNDDLARDIISEYEFSGKMQNNLIKESFSDIMGLKERRSKLKTIKEYIMNLVDKFSW